MIFGRRLRDKMPCSSDARGAASSEVCRLLAASPGGGKAVQMTNAACMTDDNAETGLRQSSEQWLRWLNTELIRCGDTPRSRLLGLWDALEDWFTSDEFATSLLATGGAELRGEPDHPVHEVIVAHRDALRQLLVGLAEAAGAANPIGLAA